ncbi:CaiB/BaiF CoA transferase family protein [Diaminobutyricibacter sp. McL0618]|uniref:CaiB/BaiF CoA transferase family protein n=1 Tax=Leifsonia sp. McL0618 TaxID=3415677 RepID=UPI003CE7FC32
MQHRPLEGIRILEIGGYISLPLGTSLLCALGAEVVKVEKPETGDDFRRHMNDKSPYFRQYNTGKLSLSVDLKSPEGVEVVKALVPHYDVVLENLRPGKLAAMGLGAEECRALRPDIIYGSVSGFGTTGPLANRPAYDTIGHAYGGLYSLWGEKGQPQLAGGLSADLLTGLTTATGVLAALVGRLRTGEPQQLETSILEAVSVLTTDAITQSFELGEAPTRTSRHPQAQNFCIKASDGQYLAIHLSSSQKFWQALCRALERPDLAEDSRFAEYRPREANYFELVPLISDAFATRAYSHWEQVLSREDVPFAPVLSITDFTANEQVAHLGLVQREEDGLELVRPPWIFDGQRPDRRGRAPRVGADTRAVLGEVLPSEQVEDLIARGVVFADEL